MGGGAERSEAERGTGLPDLVVGGPLSVSFADNSPQRGEPMALAPLRPPPRGWRLFGAPSRRALQSENGSEEYQLSSSILSTAMKASVGIWTLPRLRIRFLPSFCFSRSFFLRVMSPP